jgi:hypothetical protein
MTADGLNLALIYIGACFNPYMHFFRKSYRVRKH